MPEDELAAKIAGHRETAEALRGIAEQLRFDPRRGNQLRALAGGFERYALHLESTWPGPDALPPGMRPRGSSPSPGPTLGSPLSVGERAHRRDHAPPDAPVARLSAASLLARL